MTGHKRRPRDRVRNRHRLVDAARGSLLVRIPQCDHGMICEEWALQENLYAHFRGKFDLLDACAVRQISAVNGAKGSYAPAPA